MFFKPKGTNEAYKALGITGGFGFMMGGSIFVGYLVGGYLDKKFGTSPWLLILFIVMGVVAGFMEFYKTIKKISEDDNK